MTCLDQGGALGVDGAAGAYDTGSREYNANMSRIRQLRDIIAQHNQDLKYTSRA